MPNPINRAWYNALVDDTGTGTTGTVWNKTEVNGLLNAIDGMVAPQLFTTSNLTAVTVGTGLVVHNRLAAILVTAQYGTRWGGLFSPIGGGAGNYAGVFLGAGAASPTQVAPYITFTLFGAGEPYLLGMEAASGTLTIASSAAGTIAGTTEVRVYYIL